MSKLTHAMILAAGRGERMRPLTDTTPKPLLTVKHKALIDYHLNNLAAAEIHNIAINNAHLGEQVIAHVNACKPANIDVQHFSERPALETAGGIANALSALGDGCFLLVNGDVFCSLNFAKLHPLASLVSKAMPALIIGVNNPEHNPDGDFGMIASQSVSRLLRSAVSPASEQAQSEQSQNEELTLVTIDSSASHTFTYSGISILHCSLFQSLPKEKLALGPMLKKLAAEGKLQAALYNGLWCDVGTPERLAWINAHSVN